MLRYAEQEIMNRTAQCIYYCCYYNNCYTRQPFLIVSYILYKGCCL